MYVENRGGKFVVLPFIVTQFLDNFQRLLYHETFHFIGKLYSDICCHSMCIRVKND